MATFTFDIMTIDRGTTFVFGSWVCVANGSGGLDSHLNNPRETGMIPTGSDSLADESSNLGEMLLLDFAKEIERELDHNSSSALSQIGLSSNSTQTRTSLRPTCFRVAQLIICLQTDDQIHLLRTRS